MQRSSTVGAAALAALLVSGCSGAQPVIDVGPSVAQRSDALRDWALESKQKFVVINAVNCGLLKESAGFGKDRCAITLTLPEGSPLPYRYRDTTSHHGPDQVQEVSPSTRNFVVTEICDVSFDEDRTIGYVRCATEVEYLFLASEFVG